MKKNFLKLVISLVLVTTFSIKSSTKALANSSNSTSIDFISNVKIGPKYSVGLVYERISGLRITSQSDFDFTSISRYLRLRSFLGLKASVDILEISFDKYISASCGVMSEFGFRMPSSFNLKRNSLFIGTTEEWVLFKIDNDGFKTPINSSLKTFGNVNLIMHNQLFRYEQGPFNADVFFNCKTRIGLEQEHNIIETAKRINNKINDILTNSSFFNSGIMKNILTYLGVPGLGLKSESIDDDSL